MILAKCTIDSIAITNKAGEVIAIISDDEFIEHKDYKVTVIADQEDYKIKENNGHIELIPNKESKYNS